MKTIFTVLAVVALATPVRNVHASEPILSASKLAFGDAKTLFVADWKGARIHALTVPTAAAPVSRPFNLKEVQGPIAKALGVGRSTLRFEDMVVQPGTERAFVALTIEAGEAQTRPAIVSVDAMGVVRTLDLKAAVSTSVAINDEPPADKYFWRDLPLQTLTVTDMKYYGGQLYVAGLSDRSFASTLRIYSYPFTRAVRVATIEMYHPVHNQIETRAPIRKMAIMRLADRPTLVAAYTCTPLVTIPLADLKDGAHVSGKTIGELGWGSEPRGLVTFNVGGTDYALLVNSSRSADLLPVAELAGAANRAGLTTPIEWPTEPYEGVKATMAPLSAVDWIDNLNKDLLVALRRDAKSGDMGLVTIPKGAYLRLSDFVNEYDFADYQYPATDPFHAFHKIARALEGYPELVR